MALSPRIGNRFFATTRGRIVLLVRRAARTVDDLTEALGLTRNAVRAHLTSLERDGLVHASGARRGGGKPARLYALTPEAEELFPRGYAPVLRELLDTLAEQTSAESLRDVLRAAGRRLAAARPVPRGGVRERTAAAAALLNDLGGLAEAREVDGALVVKSWSCPLALVSPERPELCTLVESLLTEVIGVSVRERCDRRPPPRCCFEVIAA